jgi:hypothetical protein
MQLRPIDPWVMDFGQSSTEHSCVLIAILHRPDLIKDLALCGRKLGDARGIGRRASAVVAPDLPARYGNPPSRRPT